MKRFSFFMLIIFLSTTVLAFDPPKGLKWGMTYETVKDSLPNTKELKGPNVPKGFRDLSESRIPANYHRAEVKKLSILHEDAQRSWCIFDTLQNLCAFQYAFVWINDKSGTPGGKARTFYEKLFENLNAKYGAPQINEIGDKKDYNIPIGVEWQVIWQDTDSSQIHFAIGRTKKTIFNIDGFIVFLSYSRRPGITGITEKESKDF